MAERAEATAIGDNANGRLTVGSLFSGIGGIELGLERAGMEVRWNAETDPYASRVLAARWPDVPNLGDVTTIDWNEVEHVDLICGGFPCQDLSRAGRRAGLDGAKSGLWSSFADAVRHLRPRYVLVENVTSLLVRGIDRVLGDLASFGYDAEWECVQARTVGAPHLRDRVFVLAYASGGRHRAPEEALLPRRASALVHGGWPDEPQLPRVAHGVPAGVDRRRVLGNAVVPAVAELIGRRLMEVAA